jgi:hypothetical protein
MMKLRSSRPALAVIAAGVLILAAGGAAVASNMGFKLNKGLVPGGAGNIGRNWVSIPYNNPYTAGCLASAPNCAKALCDSLALPGGIGQTLIRNLNEVTGATTSTNCPTATTTTTGNGFPLVAGKAIDIRPPSTWPATGSVIIVGSHNPTRSITVPDAGAGQIGRLWFAVPYHTTAVTTRDLCLSSGLTSTIGGATITRLNPNTGAFQNAPCASNPGLTLTLGEGVQITEPQGPKTFIPAHF